MPWQVVPNGTLRALTNGTLAALLRGDAPVPRFFLTGDGHRHPPFEWTNVCTDLRLHFQTLMAANQLCVHVEMRVSGCGQRQRGTGSAATAGPAGHGLRMGTGNLPSTHAAVDVEESMRIATDDPRNPSDVVHFDRELARLHAMLWMIGNPPALTGALATHGPFAAYYRNVAKERRASSSPSSHPHQDVPDRLSQPDHGLPHHPESLYRARRTFIQRAINLHPECHAPDHLRGGAHSHKPAAKLHYAAWRRRRYRRRESYVGRGRGRRTTNRIAEAATHLLRFRSVRRGRRREHSSRNGVLYC